MDFRKLDEREGNHLTLEFYFGFALEPQCDNPGLFEAWYRERMIGMSEGWKNVGSEL